MLIMVIICIRQFVGLPKSLENYEKGAGENTSTHQELCIGTLHTDNWSWVVKEIKLFYMFFWFQVRCSWSTNCRVSPDSEFCHTDKTWNQERKGSYNCQCIFDERKINLKQAKMFLFCFTVPNTKPNPILNFIHNSSSFKKYRFSRSGS